MTLLLLWTLWAALPESRPTAEPPLRVTTYNIRYGTASDGENHWNKRKEFLRDTIKQARPDLLGTQETLAFQRDYLAKELPHLEPFGVGRDELQHRVGRVARGDRREAAQVGEQDRDLSLLALRRA